MSSLGKRKRSRGHENSLLHSVTAQSALARSAQEPPERNRKPPCSSEFYPQFSSLSSTLWCNPWLGRGFGCTYYVLITRNALNIFVFSSTHLSAPRLTAPPPMHPLPADALLQLETQNAPQKIIERVGNTRTHSSWVKNELRLFCSTLKMFSFCCFWVFQLSFIFQFVRFLFFFFWN